MPEVELWEGVDGVLALRRRPTRKAQGRRAAWVGFERNVQPDGTPSHLCLDATVLADLRAGYTAYGHETKVSRRRDETFERWRANGLVEVEWDQFRPPAGEGPLLVATWKAGVAHIIRPGEPVYRGGRAGPTALRYMSPNGANVPSGLLRLSGDWFVSSEAALVIGVTPHTMRELARPADGGVPLILVGRLRGRDWQFEPGSVFEYAASNRETGPTSLRRRFREGLPRQRRGRPETATA